MTRNCVQSKAFFSWSYTTPKEDTVLQKSACSLLVHLELIRGKVSCFVPLETGSCCDPGTQAGLEFKIFLHPLLECWDYTSVLLSLALACVFCCLSLSQTHWRGLLPKRELLSNLQLPLLVLISLFKVKYVDCAISWSSILGIIQLKFHLQEIKAKILKISPSVFCLSLMTTLNADSGVFLSVSFKRSY